MKDQAYIMLMTLLLALVAIKYQGTDTNLFKQSSPSMLLFLTAIFCHALAIIGNKTEVTPIIFNVSGVVGCETLMWIFITEFWWWYIINVLFLLVASFCFNFKDIIQLLSGTPQIPTSEPQEAPV